MGVVVCPRCRAPNDASPDANGHYRCMICEHAWKGEGLGETALTSSQQAPRARMAAANPRISQEYLPDEPANEAARALTSRRASEPNGPAKIVGKQDARPGSDMKPHSARSHGGVIPPLKVLPSPPQGSPVQPQPQPQSPAPSARPPVPRAPRVTPNTPTVEVDMDLFDRLENEAQVKRSKLNTLPELTFEAPSQASGEGRTMACPVCGHGFVATDPSKTLTCPQCHTSFNHSSGRLSTPDSPQPGVDPLIGRNLRGCVIDRKLGEGGMGSVYHASQLSLERSVAIKVLPPDLARNRNFIQRFEREAKSLAKINHPNILHIYDFGEEQNLALYFMIIEFVDGKDLGELLNRRATLPQLEMLDLLRQSALGLEMAAEKGVIHRDIKPDNLMIADTGICKVSDFGLAKGYGEENEVTSVGVRVGTPAFMSPEQCDGIEVDFRSDVYNLGCTAYLALTGHLPFDGETPFSIMLKHKSDPIPSMRDISPSIDPRVDRLIQRMIAKKPTDRCDAWRSIIDEIESIQIELAGTNSILRKTRGQMQALSASKEGAMRPVEARPATPLPSKPPPAEIRENA
ncbi:MAG: serine/threonine protein kinase, partial [Planctomycetes bacterium]|nr:serine/threonine protein kinase [Planctomycetota bacterium]